MAVFGEKHHLFRRKAAERREIEIADPAHRRAVDEIVHLIECHDTARLKAAPQARRALRLAKHELIGRQGIAEIAGHPGRQSAAADGQHDKIGDRAVRQLLDDFRRDARLSLDDVGVVEWRHHDAGDRLDVVARGLVALVENIADEADGNVFAAEDAGLVDLLLRRRHRHEDDARNGEVPADEGKALRMVSGRGADEGLARSTRCKRLAEEVEGAADLVGAHRRKILALQIDRGAVARAQMVVELQRCRRKNLAHRRGRLFNILLHLVPSSVGYSDRRRYRTLSRLKPSI
ncbi:hypothetical protein ABIA18_006070 [Sinorhizobium fredii]